MEFGTKIARLRSERGISQRDLAKRVGITQGGISHIEMNRRAPSLGLAAALARELGVSLDALTGNEIVKEVA